MANFPPQVNVKSWHQKNQCPSKNTTISVIISEAVPALSNKTAHTGTTVTEACVCPRSWGQCITAQAEVRDEPKPLALAEPFILFYPTPYPHAPVSFFKSLRFLKDKRKASCENITMETSQAHLYLPAKQLPNWSFTSYWITVGHLLSFKLLWIPYFPEKFIFRKEGGGGKGRIQYSWLVQSYCEKGR